MIRKMDFFSIRLTSLVIFVYILHLTSASSVLETIQHDKRICPSSAEIRGSKYLQKCNNLTYPGNVALNWTQTDIDLFLCMTIYDRSFQICFTGRKSPLGSSQISLLTNKTLFDNEMNKKITESSYNATVSNELALSICKSFVVNTLQLILYNETQSYVTQLMDSGNCVLSCYNSTTKRLNSLCLAINLIDEKILEVNKLAKKNTGLSGNHDGLYIDEQNKEIENPVGNDNSQKDSEKSSDLQISNDTGNIISKTQKTPLELVFQNAELPISDEGGVKRKLPGNMPTLPGKLTHQSKTALEKLPVSEYTQEIDINESNFDTIQSQNDADVIIDRFNSVGDDHTQTEPELFYTKDNLLRHANISITHETTILGYLTVIGILCVGGCVAYHHKQKILAIILEGRRSRSGRSRKRHNGANYRKLDCTLEEAVNSQCDSNTANVIY